MKKLGALALSIILTALYSMTVFAAQVPDPSKDFYVNDYAGVLTEETKSMIMKDSVALWQNTQAQIVVATVKTLEGQVLEEYSLEMLRTWGIGDKEKNNGVLLLLVVDDQFSRIEVGYGLEGALPDGKTGRIQDEFMLPYYSQGNFDEGIRNGYLALLREVAAEYQLDLSAIEEATPAGTSEEPSGAPMSTLGKVLVIGLAILFFVFDWVFLRGTITRVLVLIAFSRGGRGGGGGGGGFGGGGGGGGGGGSSRGF